MNAFRQHRGLVAPLDRANVDTDQIIPKQFLKRIERTGFGQFLFYDWRYTAEGFSIRRLCSTSRVTTVRPFWLRTKTSAAARRASTRRGARRVRLRVIIAPSFADIFANNCFKNGMLPIALGEDQVRGLMRRAQHQEGYELTIDLERQLIEDSDRLSLPFAVGEFQRLPFGKVWTTSASRFVRGSNRDYETHANRW